MGFPTAHPGQGSGTSCLLFFPEASRSFPCALTAGRALARPVARASPAGLRPHFSPYSPRYRCSLPSPRFLSLPQFFHLANPLPLFTPWHLLLESRIQCELRCIGGTRPHTLGCRAYLWGVWLCLRCAAQVSIPQLCREGTPRQLYRPTGEFQGKSRASAHTRGVRSRGVEAWSAGGRSHEGGPSEDVS